MHLAGGQSVRGYAAASRGSALHLTFHWLMPLHFERFLIR
jgi:hypothetical protein